MFDYNEMMEQDSEMLNGEGELPAEEAEAAGRGEYSPESIDNAWHDYNSLNDRQKEAFLRSHSRNAHIINMELRKEQAGSTTGLGEAAENSETQETAGYSSDYYEHQMASALKNGNQIAYDNAKSAWANAKAKEAVGSTTGSGEASENGEVGEEQEAVGHSSKYYEKQMAAALERGDKTAYKAAKAHWADAKVKETVKDAPK